MEMCKRYWLLIVIITAIFLMSNILLSGIEARRERLPVRLKGRNIVTESELTKIEDAMYDADYALAEIRLMRARVALEESLRNMRAIQMSQVTMPE